MYYQISEADTTLQLIYYLNHNVTVMLVIMFNISFMNVSHGTSQHGYTYAHVANICHTPSCSNTLVTYLENYIFCNPCLIWNAMCVF